MARYPAHGWTPKYRATLQHDPCCYCGRPPISTTDHIHPRAPGDGRAKGSSGWANLTAACHQCNQQKDTAPLLLFFLTRHNHATKGQPPMMTATYSPDDNKLRLYASSRLDADTYARVKAAGFQWAPKQDLFVAPMWTPSRADLLLELAGEIGDEDTSLIDRAEGRAERFEDYREHRTQDAESARRAVAAIADNIPLGQPILVGHHSERHARKDAERIENGMRRAIKMWDTAQYWKDRAAGALRHAKYKELPGVRARRIKTIEADRRRQVRDVEKTRAMLKLWASLRKPGKDGRPCDLDLEYKRACYFANVGMGYQLWSDLDKRTITPREAQLRICQAGGRNVVHALRWIAHDDHRLDYERAMLAEAGELRRLDKKPRPALLPLLNYRQTVIVCPNRYNRGETIKYPQIEMTSAEYATIPADYKGTRVCEGTHRVRTTMQRHALVAVFLTDGKVHARPDIPPTPGPAPTGATMPAADHTTDAGPCNAPGRAPENPNLFSETRENANEQPRAHDPGATFQAMRDSLKAGVQVVTAPQLFPTPPELAGRMIAAADIRAAHTVLEPSAGTGAITWAILQTQHVASLTAVEINRALAERLEASHGFEIRTSNRVICADFLQCNGNLGTFDRVLMNPPFADGQDIDHVRHAFAMLKPAGRLVAIMSEGPFFRGDRKASEFRDWLEQQSGTSERLPADTFKPAGTSVHARLVVIDRV